ncbi:MAG: hypothetical protein KAG62_03775 [Caulobacter sp.]|jgi:hypothetical protein|nr:hypothetical protein [Caulobacter sp.]
MNRRFVVAKLRGAQDVSGIILPETTDRSQLLQRGAELLSHLTASRVGPQDVELLPYFPPERDQIRLAS